MNAGANADGEDLHRQYRGGGCVGVSGWGVGGGGTGAGT